MGGVADEQFRRWLRAGMTGCEFAKLLSVKAERTAIELHALSYDPPTASLLNSAFDTHSEFDRVAIAVFPRLAPGAGLVELLNALRADERWTLRRRPKPSPAGGVQVGLEWRTASGDVSDVMGFAPLESMPVSRRAPYVAIATWPGRRSNPFRGQGSTPAAMTGSVSFLDASHGIELEAYERRWASTAANVAGLMTEPPDDARLYRRTAFVVSEELAARLDFTP